VICYHKAADKLVTLLLILHGFYLYRRVAYLLSLFLFGLTFLARFFLQPFFLKEENGKGCPIKEANEKVCQATRVG
jgi:hypothetical protein